MGHKTQESQDRAQVDRGAAVFSKGMAIQPLKLSTKERTPPIKPIWDTRTWPANLTSQNRQLSLLKNTIDLIVCSEEGKRTVKAKYSRKRLNTRRGLIEELKDQQNSMLVHSLKPETDPDVLFRSIWLFPEKRGKRGVDRGSKTPTRLGIMESCQPYSLGRMSRWLASLAQSSLANYRSCKMSKYLTSDNQALFPLIARALLRKAKKDFGSQVNFGLELVCIHRNQAMLQKVDKISGGVEEIVSKMLNFQEEVRCNTSHGWPYRNLAQKVYCLHVYNNQDKISSLVLLEFARIETDSSKLNRLTPDQLAWMTLERQTLKRLLDGFKASSGNQQGFKHYPEDGGVDFEEMKSLKLNSILENAFEAPAHVYILAFFGKNRNSNLKIQEIVSDNSRNLKEGDYQLRDHHTNIATSQLRVPESTQDMIGPGGRFSLNSNPETLQVIRSSSGTAAKGGQNASEVLISNQNHLQEGPRESRSKTELDGQQYQSLSSERSRQRPEEMTGGFGNPNMSFHDETQPRGKHGDPDRLVSESRPSYFEHNVAYLAAGKKPKLNGTQANGSRGKNSNLRDSRTDSSEQYRQQGWRNSDDQVEDLEDQPTHPKPRERRQPKISLDTRPVRSINDRITTAKRKTIQARDCSPASRVYAHKPRSASPAADANERSDSGSNSESGEEDSYIEAIFEKAGVVRDRRQETNNTEQRSGKLHPIHQGMTKSDPRQKGAVALEAAGARTDTGEDQTEELFGFAKARLVGLVAGLQAEQTALKGRAEQAESEAAGLKQEMTKLLEKLLQYKAEQRETKKQLRQAQKEGQILAEDYQKLEKAHTSGEVELEEALQAQQSLQEELSRTKAMVFKTQTTSEGLQQSLKDERSRIAQLKEELAATQASYQAEKRDLLARIKSLDDALLRAREDAAKERLGAEKNTLDATDYKRKFELCEAKKEDLEFKLRQTELEASKCRQELEMKSRRTMEFALKQELKDAEISRLKQDLEVYKTAASKADNLLQNALLEKARLEERIKYHGELSNQNQELTHQLQVQAQEILNLQNNLETANSVIEEKLTEITGLREKLAKQEKTKRQYQDLKGQVADLKSLLAEAEERVEKISLEFLTLRTVTEEKKGEAETLRQRLDFLSQEKEQLQRSAESHRKEQENLQSELREAMSDRGVHRQEFEAANQRIKAARIENNRLRKDNEELAQRAALAEEEIRRIHDTTAAMQSQRISSKKEALNEIKGLIAIHRENLLTESQNPILGGGDENQAPTSGFRNSSSPHIGRSSRIAQYLRNTAHLHHTRPSLNQSHHLQMTQQDSPESNNRRSVSFATGGKPHGFVGSSRLG